MAQTAYLYLGDLRLKVEDFGDAYDAITSKNVTDKHLIKCFTAFVRESRAEFHSLQVGHHTAGSD